MKNLIIGLFVFFMVVAGGGVYGYVGGSDFYTLSSGETVPACYIINHLGHSDLYYKSYID